MIKRAKMLKMYGINIFFINAPLKKGMFCTLGLTFNVCITKIKPMPSLTMKPGNRA